MHGLRRNHPREVRRALPARQVSVLVLRRLLDNSSHSQRTMDIAPRQLVKGGVGHEPPDESRRTQFSSPPLATLSVERSAGSVEYGQRGTR